ncbi:MAG: sigma-54-dependent Fis family transcriptional regulator [Candidatus Hydrogenedentes bacterium]|nr:sigma-54-dependent Fis family transcriptional regulator [Candidatus Hydrogenedentota bacterium]
MAGLSQRIQVVDDEASMRELLEIVLTNDGYEVQTAPGVKGAVAALEKETFDAVVMDLRMGADRDAGMTLLTWVQEHAPATPSIMMTAHGSVETAIEAMKRGAADYLMKPFKNDEIKLLIRRAIQQRNLLRENVALRTDQAKRGKVENLIGASNAIETVREMIRRVASLPSTVAIHGESGTGKELVARGIHQLSDRAGKPFVAINCGGVPENLLESELFGHKKGSFTGAIEDKEGLFVVADGGTLFLDEIGEMPLALQVKLLRVLDNSVVTPVGGTTGIKVNVRIISATNRKLSQMAQEGTFREDLYYRLNVIPIVVPPLRDRADDIPLLARHFVTSHTAKLGRGKLDIAPDAEQVLRNFRWPGNVRELENVLERAVALCNGEHIELSDLPDNVRNFVSTPGKNVSELPKDGLDLEALVSEIEINLIQQALRNSKYSQKKAADLLGLTPRSLRYRLKKYGLETD